MGLDNLNKKLQDPEYQEAFVGIFPKDHPKDVRFAINFFTLIGLGGLTVEMRNYLKSMARPAEMEAEPEVSSESSDSSNSDSSSDSSSSSDSESEDDRKKGKNQKDSKKRR